MNRLTLAILIPCFAFAEEPSHFRAFANALVWCAKESRTNNWAQVFQGSCNKLNIDALNVPFGWDAGFKLGLGYEMEHDKWDTLLRYTWFRTQAAKSADTTDGKIASSFVGNFYVGNADGSGMGPSYRKASISWAILFNMFDFELGRSYPLSNALSLRPFIGIKGGWIRQNIHSKWQDPVGSTFSAATENLRNNYFGIGPSIGLGSKWTVYVTRIHELSLFGDFSVAPMFGHWSFKDRYQNDTPESVSIHLPSLNGGSTTLSSFAGLGWKAYFNEKKFRFGAKLGYEMQFWLDQLQLYSLNAGRLDDELTLQGATIEVSLDF